MILTDDNTKCNTRKTKRCLLPYIVNCLDNSVPSDLFTKHKRKHIKNRVMKP